MAGPFRKGKGNNTFHKKGSKRTASAQPKVKSAADEMHSNLCSTSPVLCIGFSCHATAHFENGTHVIRAAASCTFRVESSDNVKKKKNVTHICSMQPDYKCGAEEERRNRCWIQSAEFHSFHSLLEKEERGRETTVNLTRNKYCRSLWCN